MSQSPYTVTVTLDMWAWTEQEARDGAVRIAEQASARFSMGPQHSFRSFTVSKREESTEAAGRVG